MSMDGMKEGMQAKLEEMKELERQRQEAEKNAAGGEEEAKPAEPVEVVTWEVDEHAKMHLDASWRHLEQLLDAFPELIRNRQPGAGLEMPTSAGLSTPGVAMAIPGMEVQVTGMEMQVEGDAAPAGAFAGNSEGIAEAEALLCKLCKIDGDAAVLWEGDDDRAKADNFLNWLRKIKLDDEPEFYKGILGEYIKYEDVGEVNANVQLGFAMKMAPLGQLWHLVSSWLEACLMYCHKLKRTVKLVYPDGAGGGASGGAGGRVSDKVFIERSFTCFNQMLVKIHGTDLSGEKEKLLKEGLVDADGQLTKLQLIMVLDEFGKFSIDDMLEKLDLAENLYNVDCNCVMQLLRMCGEFDKPKVMKALAPYIVDEDKIDHIVENAGTFESDKKKARDALEGAGSAHSRRRYEHRERRGYVGEMSEGSFEELVGKIEEQSFTSDKKDALVEGLQGVDGRLNTEQLCKILEIFGTFSLDHIVALINFEKNLHDVTCEGVVQILDGGFEFDKGKLLRALNPYISDPDNKEAIIEAYGNFSSDTTEARLILELDP